MEEIFNICLVADRNELTSLQVCLDSIFHNLTDTDRHDLKIFVICDNSEYVSENIKIEPDKCQNLIFIQLSGEIL